jgi:hypothetical protein
VFNVCFEEGIKMLKDWFEGKPKKANIPITIQNQVLVEQGYRCNECDLKLPPKYFFCHVKPIEEGGTNSIKNVIALCPNCHCQMDYEMHFEKNKGQYQKDVDSVSQDNVILS